MPGTKGRSGGDRKTDGIDLFPKDGMPKKPEHLTGEESEKWDEIICQLPGESLRAVDVHQLYVLVNAICMFKYYAAREKELDDPKDQRSAATSKKENAAVMDKLSARFGLTPKDRQSIKFEAVEIDDAADWEAS